MIRSTLLLAAAALLATACRAYVTYAPYRLPAAQPLLSGVAHSVCGCPSHYRPMCCSTPKGTFTTASFCECQCFSGGYLHDFAPCAHEVDTCKCPMVYDPVCCHNPLTGNLVTSGNACGCTCAQGIVVRKGKC